MVMMNVVILIYVLLIIFTEFVLHTVGIHGFQSLLSIDATDRLTFTGPQKGFSSKRGSD